MANEDDVIVFDEEYRYATKQIMGYSDALTKMIMEYLICVNIILSEAIQDEKISSELRGIVEQVKSVIGDIRTICDEASKTCFMYVSEINVADDFLYEGGMNICLK